MENRQLLNDLRALGKVHAPTRVLEAILDEVELSDRYASLETSLGPVFVAWNRQGVSAGMKTATPAEFEAQFRARFHRSPRPAPELPRLRFDLGGVVWTRVRCLLELSQSVWKPIQVLEHPLTGRYLIEWLRLTGQSGEEYPPLNFIAGRIVLTQSRVIYFTRMENVRSQREALLTASSNIKDKGMLREKFMRRRQPLRPADKIEIDCYSRRKLAEIMDLDFDITGCKIIAIKATPARLPTCNNIAGRPNFFRRDTDGTGRRELLR